MQSIEGKISIMRINTTNLALLAAYCLLHFVSYGASVFDTTVLPESGGAGLCRGAWTDWAAQRFTTDSSSDLTVRTISIYVSSVPATNIVTITATVLDDNSGSPASGGPGGNFSTTPASAHVGLNTLSGAVTLQPNTSYWVRFDTYPDIAPYCTGLSAATIGNERGTGAWLNYPNDYVFAQWADDSPPPNPQINSNIVLRMSITNSGPLLPPTITAQPQSAIVHAGENATFSVSAVGDPPLSYQWSLEGTNLLAATSSSLTVLSVAQKDLGAYVVVVSNPEGAVTSSNAVLSMYPFLAIPFSGALTTWGKSAKFSVRAWGTSPLSYQWFKDGATVRDATNQDLTLSSIQFTNAGLYWVVVSNVFGSVTNPPAQVVVNPAGVSLGLYPGVTIDGVVGYNYTIQRSPDLSNTNAWMTITNLTLEQPLQLWLDTSVDASIPANPYRFYRVLPGP